MKLKKSHLDTYAIQVLKLRGDALIILKRNV